MDYPYWWIGWMDKRYTEQYDCAAFFVEVQRTEFGRELTLPQDTNLSPAFIRRHWPSEWTKVGSPGDGDAALMKGAEGYHLGIVGETAHGQIVIVHNSKAAGGVLVNTPNVRFTPIEGYYRWNKH